jgi:DNA-binding MarR family transcriptional regulator
MTDLRVSTGLNRTSLSSAVARLRERSMLVRYQVPGDRRHRTVELTHVGRGSAQMLDPALEAINRRLGWRLDDSEPETLSEFADALHEIEHPWGAARLG